MSQTEVEPFSDRLYSAMKPLVELMTELQEVGIEKYVELPRIAVVGEQSAGKSSVLESIVGDDFLPKSDELCTRRPLNLRLKRKERGDTTIRIKNDETWETLGSFHELTERILSCTKDKAGDNGNIVDDQIFVEIEKEDCPEITLIDLPGIAKNPLADSEQPENIEEITKNLISTYISQKQTIILCVVAGNVDAAASDAIKIAKQYDPEGVRTIGVCTKIDIMDKGTNVKKMLDNKYVKLTLGWTAVKNRSKQEVKEGKSIMQARIDETSFFNAHEVYSTMEKSLFGTESLSTKLMAVMQRRIEEEIPSIQDQVEKRFAAAANGLKELGAPPPSSSSEISRYVGDLLNQFLDDLRDRIEGNQIAENSNNDFYGPGFLYNSFFAYAHLLEQNTEVRIDPKRLKHLLLNAAPLSGFGSFKAFKQLTKEQVEGFLSPSTALVDQIAAHMALLGSDSLKSLQAKNFPLLLKRIDEVTKSCISESLELAKKEVLSFLASQDFVFTASEEYEELARPESTVSAVAKTSPFKHKYTNRILNISTASEEEMTTALKAYLKKKREVIEDAVPQKIGYIFTDRKAFQAKMRAMLEDIRALPNLEKLICEPEKVQFQRAKLSQEKEILEKARRVLLSFSL